jgi:heptosyltransferase I
MKPPDRILIIRLSSLGDILHACPAFASLRGSFPDAEIDWLVEERTRFLLSAIPGINQVQVIDTPALRSHPFDRTAWARNLRVIRTLRSRRYSVVLDFQGLIKTGVLSLLTGAARRLGFARELVREAPAAWFYTETLARPPVQLHITDQNRALAEMTGAMGAPALLPLSAPESDETAVRTLLQQSGVGDFVVINPGGGWYTKRWNPVQYGSLAQRIRINLGLDVVMTTAPGEESIRTSVLRGAGDARLFDFQLGFLRLIPLFRRAKLVIGGDTGPIHLACALGTPVVGILGPTAPKRNGPWGVLDETVIRMLPCSFCGKRKCPTQNECMDIGEEVVFRAVVRRLQRESRHATE